MKNTTKTIAAMMLFLAAAAFTSCSSAEGDKTVAGEKDSVPVATGKTLSIDAASTSIGFTGYGVGKDHPGKFSLKSGSLNVEGGKLTGGKFVIDINSMTMDQTEDFITGKLRPHLLSPDFFDVAKFPEASFEISKVEPYTATATDSSAVAGANQMVSGNLTLKGVTKSISFPAKVDVTESSATAVANFNIDRTSWDMKYGNDKSLKDKFISEQVSIRVNLSAK